LCALGSVITPDRSEGHGLAPAFLEPGAVIEALHSAPQFAEPLPPRPRLRQDAVGAGFGRPPLASHPFPWVGAALAFYVAARAARRRGNPVPRRAAELAQTAEANDESTDTVFLRNEVIKGASKFPNVTDEEANKFMEERCSELQELMGQTDDEFDDEIDEYRWLWARELLPFLDHRRHDIAAYKTRTVKKQKEFYRQLKLFQPLSIKYPTMVKRRISDVPSVEDKSFKLNPMWFIQQERVAGFTYTDWAKCTVGNTYEGWSKLNVGDLVPGTVMSTSGDGAFIEIGAKTWAFMPLKECSLKPIADAKEVMQIGEEVEARIIAGDADSVVGGDPNAKQFIVSRSELLFSIAWQQMIDTAEAKEGTDPIMEVDVLQMRPSGAIVETEMGLRGVIPNSELADLAGSAALTGQKLRVELREVRRELATNTSFDGRQDPFAITFSYKNFATKELASTVVEGDILTGKIVVIRDASMDVLVNGAQVQIKKLDLSAQTRFTIDDHFKLEQEIKLGVLSVNVRNGEVRLATRCFERQPGEILRNMEKVFERAEETAVKYFNAMKKLKDKRAQQLEPIFAASKKRSNASGPPVGLVDDDDDDDDDIF